MKNSYLVKHNFRCRKMSYTIVEEKTYVGTHEPKKLVKQLTSVLHKWYSVVEGKKGVLFWPPEGTKPGALLKLLNDGKSAPNKDTWKRLEVVCKRENIRDYKSANDIINQMKCNNFFVFCFQMYRNVLILIDS